MGQINSKKSKKKIFEIIESSDPIITSKSLSFYNVRNQLSKFLF